MCSGPFQFRSLSGKQTRHMVNTSFPAHEPLFPPLQFVHFCTFFCSGACVDFPRSRILVSSSTACTLHLLHDCLYITLFLSPGPFIVPLGHYGMLSFWIRCRTHHPFAAPFSLLPQLREVELSQMYVCDLRGC